MKNFIFLSVFMCVPAHAMNDRFIKKLARSCDAEGKEIFVDTDGAPLKDVSRQTEIIVEPCSDEGAEVLKRKTAYFVRINTAYRNGGYSISKQVGPLDCIDEKGQLPSILLIRDTSMNGQFSCDVLYRTTTGRVVAKNLNSEKEIYSVELPRMRGDYHEMLLQTEQGEVVVLEKDGTIYSWSHQDKKNQIQ